ncbi:CoA transferase [Microbacterium sp.]|uniref:CoA transferase n=1 Tax=Microbacterium sp. TaxID=51671 RepID=UPI003A86F540
MDDITSATAHLWRATSRQNEAMDSSAAPMVTGPRVVLPSVFDVTGLAGGAVAVATQAAADLLAVRQGTSTRAVSVDSHHACAAFQPGAWFTPQGWRLPPLWDPLSGNYRTADGWIRLHTNYAAHRVAVEQALGAHDRDGVAAAVVGQRRIDVESAVIEAGGAAAAMATRSEWLVSQAGSATATASAFDITDRSMTTPARWTFARPDAPFSGLRVLDLTRVLAGPTCTKFFAAYGADVLRIDPPGFEEVGALLPETTQGKRTAALDLTADSDRVVFEELVVQADVIVIGLRADALPGLGYGATDLKALNPDVIIASLDAYGWVGPWRHRRGFDSLVQMSCGIAATGTDAPNPLPVQALDYGTGWLLAAAITRILVRQLTESVTATITTSLVATANLLYEVTELAGERVLTQALAATPDLALEPTSTAWGSARRAPFPGRIDSIPAKFAHDAGPLGRHPATWQR